MLKAGEIIDLMDKWAPPELIEDWDNTGFQIGDRNQEVDRILVSLDLSREVLDMAIEGNYNMIITHHPLIFKPLKKITSNNYKEKLILDIIKNNILVYNAHTNLDLAIGGVNDELARLIGLRNTKPLSVLDQDREDIGYGRLGEIDEIELKDFIPRIKSALEVDKLTVYGELDRKVKNIGVCGGSGSGFILDAYKKDLDLYITGDIKYHDGELGHNLGLTIVDAGHFHTEKIILPVIKDYLNNNLREKPKIKLVIESSIGGSII